MVKFNNYTMVFFFFLVFFSHLFHRLSYFYKNRKPIRAQRAYPYYRDLNAPGQLQILRLIDYYLVEFLLIFFFLVFNP